jgi:cyclopropane fatty-acyl-phospholipid synthase-like methyltransferase
LDTATHDKWLADTRRFWDADSEFVARYRRICSSPAFDAARDEAELTRLWEEETRKALALILQGIPLEPAWHCLEIGCGIGRLMKALASRCARVTGVDLSERMAAWSREYLADAAAAVVVNDGRSLPGIADASIDFVYSHLAFQHITLFEVVNDYLAEIRRVLQPGGWCRIQNWRDAAKPWRESFKDMVRPLLGRQRYRSSRCWTWAEGKDVKFGGVVFHPRDWRRLLARHGFVITELTVGAGHDFWMWTTFRKPV